MSQIIVRREERMEWARKAYSAARQSRRLVLSSSSETYRGRPRLGRDSACGKRLQRRAIGDLGATGMGGCREHGGEGYLGDGKGLGLDW